MTQSYPAQIERDAHKTSTLAERMDPAIGEASSVMGAMLTELLRRTLRGGVMKIGDELHNYAENVDATIADRTPAIERAAAEVAEHTARTAATEVATEEVQALEKRTQEMSRDLAAQIEATGKSAELKTAEAARDLTGRIEAAEKQVRADTTQLFDTLVERARERSRRLKNRFADLEKLIGDLGTQLRAELAQLEQMNQELTARVAELERPRGLRALWARIFKRPQREKAHPPAGSPTSSERISQ
jgi:DNA repair exonuclease SbcCD ATPase subunit